MAGFTYIHYDGDDDRIFGLVSKLLGGKEALAAIPKPNANTPNTIVQEIARKFAHHVSQAAAGGNEAQKKAMLAWLKSDGEVELTALWHAAGVKRQHDYSGVGGSLTKNMKKSNGPKDWYAAEVNGSGEWIYKIKRELVEPLKEAFAVRAQQLSETVNTDENVPTMRQRLILDQPVRWTDLSKGIDDPEKAYKDLARALKEEGFKLRVRHRNTEHETITMVRK